jgi:hypothetical protein
MIIWRGREREREIHITQDENKVEFITPTAKSRRYG